MKPEPLGTLPTAFAGAEEELSVTINGIFDRLPALHGFAVQDGARLLKEYPGAALEGALAKIPSIAFSQDSQRKEYALSAQIAAKIVERALHEGLAPYTFLNVNIPAGEPKGVKVAPMGDAFYLLDRFETSGDQVKPILKRGVEFMKDRDTAFYAEGYVTVAPLQVDWSANDSINAIDGWQLELPK